jgi:pimeloyl-ACP methyl ester carboxylesterase
MQGALPENKLAATWSNLKAELGELRSFHAIGADQPHGHDRRLYELVYERGTLEARIAFKQGEIKVSGLFFAKKHLRQDETAAGPANPAVGATEITFGTAPYSLGGTITYPKNANGKLAAVLLVPGSGPQDRDETLGPNKPFRDLAEGLSARQIVVLRFDKRTLSHPEQYSHSKDVNVDKEVVDDAVEALHRLREFVGVDPDRIYVVGHSLGALVAPDIATRGGPVAGLILLGVPGRPIPEIVIDQLKATKAPAADVAAAGEKFRLLASHQLAPDAQVFGAPASYWWDLGGRDEPAVAKRLGKPVLLVRGERDYQVSAADQAIWEGALGTQAHATTLPGLSHLFMKAGPSPGPQDYAARGEVDEALIDLIAAFVATNAAPSRSSSGP